MKGAFGRDLGLEPSTSAVKNGLDVWKLPTWALGGHPDGEDPKRLTGSENRLRHLSRKQKTQIQVMCVTAVQRYFGSITSMTSKRFKPFHVKSTKQFKLTKNKKKQG